MIRELCESILKKYRETYVELLGMNEDAKNLIIRAMMEAIYESQQIQNMQNQVELNPEFKEALDKYFYELLD